MYAGYGPRVPYWPPALLHEVARTWCSGDEDTARWILARIWARERLHRWGRALAAVPLAYLTVTVSWWWAAAVLTVLLLTRTRSGWALDLKESWLNHRELRDRMLKERGHLLPGVAVLDSRSAATLLAGVSSDAVRETAQTLAPEWHGTVGDLLEASEQLCR